MRTKKVMKLASRGKRFGAFCIDSVVPVISCLIFFSAIVAALVVRFMYSPGFGYGFGNPGFGYGYDYGYGYGRGLSAGTVAAMIISCLLGLAYIVVQLIMFNRSRTIGKAALGLQVVSSADGEPIGFWKMLFREWFVKQASAAVFLLGFIWVLIDDKNRGWHDKILDTYVVDLKESAALNSERPSAGSGAGTPPPAPKSAPLPVPASVMEESAGSEDIEVIEQAQEQAQEQTQEQTQTEAPAGTPLTEQAEETPEEDVHK